MNINFKEFEFEIERRDIIINLLKGKRERLRGALQDVVDGLESHDLRDQTGLSEERCKEIIKLAWGEE